MNTPDTEWEVIDEPLHISAEALFKCQCKTKELLSSRDTYWKERVRKEEKWNKTWGNAHAQFVSNVMDGMKPEEAYRTLNKTLDTLLDNLK